MTPEIVFPNLGIQFSKLDKIALSIGNFNIFWYGIIIGLGVLSGLLLSQYIAKKENFNTEYCFDFLIYAVIISLIFARAYYVIFTWDDFKDNLAKIFAVREGGLAIYGAVIGATLTLIVYTKIKKINFFKFADIAAFGLILGQAIGRWGNFVNREAFGGYTDNILAIRYLKSQTSNLTPDILSHIVSVNGVDYIQVHPTFLYESLWNFILLIILLIHRKNKTFNGEIASLYFIFYGIGRFWIEGLRTDQLIIGHTGIAISQILSIVFVICWLIFFIINKLKTKKSKKIFS